MPEYPYECNNCDYAEYRKFSMKENRPEKLPCPKCKGSLVKKFSTCAINIPSTFNNDPSGHVKFDKRPSRRKQYY